MLFSLDGTATEDLYTAWELPGEDEDLVESESSSAGMVMRLSAGRAFEPPLALDLLTDGRLTLVDSNRLPPQADRSRRPCDRDGRAPDCAPSGRRNHHGGRTRALSRGHGGNP